MNFYKDSSFGLYYQPETANYSCFGVTVPLIVSTYTVSGTLVYTVIFLLNVPGRRTVE